MDGSTLVGAPEYSQEGRGGGSPLCAYS